MGSSAEEAYNSLGLYILPIRPKKKSRKYFVDYKIFRFGARLF